MSVFAKASKGANSFFKKGGTADVGFRKVSSGLGQAGRVLSNVGGAATSVLSNPLFQGVALMAAPELAPEILAGGALAAGLAKKAGKASTQVSNITNVSSYKGNRLENIQDAQKRLGVDGPQFDGQPAAQNFI